MTREAKHDDVALWPLVEELQSLTERLERAVDDALLMPQEVEAVTTEDSGGKQWPEKEQYR